MVESAKSRGVGLNLTDIQKLVDMLDKSSLQEMELDIGGTKLRLVKVIPQAERAPQGQPIIMMAPPAGMPVAAPPVAQAAPAPASPQAKGAAPAEAAAPAPAKSATAVDVKSPMVGTFYRAPAPGADPFVKIGDRVKKGQTLCIIEAMKLMNEIEAEVEGTVVDVLVENAQPVEYGERLFLVEPGA